MGERFEIIHGLVAQRDPSQDSGRYLELLKQGKRAEARAHIAEMSPPQTEAPVRQVVSADEAAMLRASNG
jgi:hypothetical protein